MKQDKSLKNALAGLTFSEQMAVIKASQKEDAKRRSMENVPRKSMRAVSATPEQSELTNTPPTLYTPPKINIPADFDEVARLLFREFSRIAESQSIVLTLWQQWRTAHLNATFESINANVYAVPVSSVGLGDVDLDTLTGSHYGQYFQQYSASATAENHYPVYTGGEQSAGSLEIIRSYATGAEGCHQIYRPYDRHNIFYQRVYATEAWTPWAMFTGADPVIT